MGVFGEVDRGGGCTGLGGAETFAHWPCQRQREGSQHHTEVSVVVFLKKNSLMPFPVLVCCGLKIHMKIRSSGSDFMNHVDTSVKKTITK